MAGIVDQLVRGFRRVWMWHERQLQRLWRSEVAVVLRKTAYDAFRHAPRRFVAPLVGATMGAVEYTNAASDLVPVSRARAKIYARLLSAFLDPSAADPAYLRQLARSALRRCGDPAQEVRLTGVEDDDLRSLGCPPGGAPLSTREQAGREH